MWQILYLFFHSTDILVHGLKGLQEDLICFLLSSNTLSDAQKQNFLACAKDVSNLQDQQVDTESHGDAYHFSRWHLGAWNKMAWLVHNSCFIFGFYTHIWGFYSKNHPNHEPVREYLANATQSQPYFDRSVISLAMDFDESHFHQCLFQDFNEALHEVLQPVLAKVSTLDGTAFKPYISVCQLELHLPELMGQHEELYSSLGPAFKLGSAPFCMTVLNIQPATCGHCDHSDMVDSICLVLALGDYQGGELCLFEAGLVLELAHGSFVAICSKRDVHFNLDFVGQRLSFVFTSDQTLQRWRDHRNGWKELQANE